MRIKSAFLNEQRRHLGGLCGTMLFEWLKYDRRACRYMSIDSECGRTRRRELLGNVD